MTGRSTDKDVVARALGISEKLAEELVSALEEYERVSQSIMARFHAHDDVLDVVQRIMAHLSAKAARAGEVGPASG